mgnify:CR=1 FL=1
MRFKVQTTNRERFIWNMVGSMSNALSSFALLTIVTRLNGVEDAGLFSIAFSTAQLLTTISCFETRSIQATDVKGELDFKDYFTFRVVTCCIMMFAALGFVFYNDYHGSDATLIILISLYKAIDGISDSYQGMFQQQNRIDLSGKALGFRVILSTIGFTLILAATHNLVLAGGIMVIISVIFIYNFDRALSVYFSKAKISFNFSKMKFLFWQCLPLFIGSFMLSYVINASKYAIEKYSTNAVQTYYGFLLMPAFVINLFSLFAFRPMMTTLAISWEKKDFKNFMKIIYRSFFWILFLTIGAVLGAYLLGIYILNIISGENLSPYRLELCIIMLGGGLNALITVFYYVLTIMRKQGLILLSYTIGFISSLVSAPLLVRSMGITGATIAYGLPMLLITIFMAIFMFCQLRKHCED